MKSGFCLFALTCLIASAQTTSVPPPGQLKARGPEAVTQQDPKRVVATIGGKQITAEEASTLLKPINADDMKRFANNLPQLVQQLYIQQQLAEQAQEQHLDQQSPIKEQLKAAHDNVLAQAYLAKLSAPAGPPPDLQKYYNDHATDFDEVKLSGILVLFTPPGGQPPANGKPARTEEAAKAKAAELEQKIKGGADFDALAKTESDNPRAELGTFRGSDKNLPPDLKTAIFQLQAGQVSEPIRQPSGYYIFKVTARSRKSFQDAQAEIAQILQQERGQTVLKEQFSKYSINVQDPDFFNVTPAASVRKIPSLANPKPAPAAPPKQ